MDLVLFEFNSISTNRETMPDFRYGAVRLGCGLLGKTPLLPLFLGYEVKLVPKRIVRTTNCSLGLWNGRVHDLKMLAIVAQKIFCEQVFAEWR